VEESKVNRNAWMTAALLVAFCLPSAALSTEVYTKGSVVNVRAGGGAGYEIISQVTRGQRLELLDRQGDWSNVRLPGGMEGWIFSSLVSNSPPPAEPPPESTAIAEGYKRKGTELFYQGMYEQAIEQYKAAQNILKKDADIYYNIANSYYREGLPERAEDEHLKAIGLRPNHLQARNNLALIYFEQGKYRKAAEEWEKALEYDPGYVEANFNLAQVYEKVDLDKAVMQWRRYLEAAEGEQGEAELVEKVKERLSRLVED
jgi:tetratricopeptide (TPR) repeat protein